MKYFAAANLIIAASLFTGSAMAAKPVSKETMADTEYMMRKVVEDIHARNLRSKIIDVTLDKSIRITGKAIKFIAARKDAKTGEVFRCARIALSARIQTGKKTSEKIKRTDEICTNTKSGDVIYKKNVH